MVVIVEIHCRLEKDTPSLRPFAETASQKFDGDLRLDRRSAEMRGREAAERRTKAHFGREDPNRSFCLAAEDAKNEILRTRRQHQRNDSHRQGVEMRRRNGDSRGSENCRSE